MKASIRQLLGEDSVSLELLSILADNSFDAILVTDASKSGKIIYSNAAFTKLTGHKPDEVLGKTPRILQGPATDKHVITKLRKALSTGRKFEGKAVNYKKDKTPFIMHWRVLPIKSGRIIKAWIAIQREAGSI